MKQKISRKKLNKIFFLLCFTFITPCPANLKIVESTTLTGYWKSSYGTNFAIDKKHYIQYDVTFLKEKKR